MSKRNFSFLVVGAVAALGLAYGVFLFFSAEVPVVLSELTIAEIADQIAEIEEQIAALEANQAYLTTELTGQAAEGKDFVIVPLVGPNPNEIRLREWNLPLSDELISRGYDASDPIAFGKLVEERTSPGTYQKLYEEGTLCRPEAKCRAIIEAFDEATKELKALRRLKELVELSKARREIELELKLRERERE